MEKAKDTINRRDFFRTVALTSLTGSALALFIKAYQSGEDCIGNGKCKKCLSNTKCELPLAKVYRTDLVAE